jgi:hypothetical protein
VRRVRPRSFLVELPQALLPRSGQEGAVDVIDVDPIAEPVGVASASRRDTDGRTLRSIVTTPLVPPAGTRTSARRPALVEGDCGGKIVLADDGNESLVID